MNLLIIWIGFILSVSYSSDFNQSQFLLSSNLMFCLTYLYNQVSDVTVSLKTTLILLNVPSLILWYVAFVYNDFLAINPISYELFIGLFFIHSYLTLYLIVDEELNNS